MNLKLKPEFTLLDSIVFLAGSTEMAAPRCAVRLNRSKSRDGLLEVKL